MSFSLTEDSASIMLSICWRDWRRQRLISMPHFILILEVPLVLTYRNMGLDTWPIAVLNSMSPISRTQYFSHLCGSSLGSVSENSILTKFTTSVSFLKWDLPFTMNPYRFVFRLPSLVLHLLIIGISWKSSMAAQDALSKAVFMYTPFIMYSVALQWDTSAVK